MLNYSYSTFGLNIKSEIELPELIRGNGHSPDLLISEGKVTDNLADSVEYKGSFQYAGNEFLFKSRNSGKFLIRNNNQIIFEKYKDSTYDDIRVLLLSIVLGIVLHKKDKFPLHASAVEYNGKAVLFAGPCGIGKSTLAAGFMKRGCKLISDDITVIENVDNKFLAIPSFPQIKLWIDSLKALGYDSLHFSKVRPKVEKRKMVLDEMVSDRIELSRIYFLSTNNMFKYGIKNLNVSEKISFMESNTYRVKHLMQIGNNVKHFQTCCSLAENVPIKKIDRPRGVFELDKLIDMVMDDLKNNYPD